MSGGMRNEIGDGPSVKALKYITKQLARMQEIIAASGGGGGGSATAANQVIGNNSLASIDGKTPALSAGRVPVDVQNSILPSGASTSANQTTANNSLSSIDTKLTSQATSANQLTEISSLSTIASKDLLITGQGGQTAVGQNIILPIAGTSAYDISGYKSIAIQIIPTGTVSSGVVTFEASNDGVTFVAIPLYDEASLTANPISTVSPATGVNRFFLGPVHWRYFRARISTVIGGGGSLQAIAIINKEPYTPDIFTITQATAANLNMTATLASTTLSGGQTAHSAASTGNPVRVGGRVAPTTIATQDTSLVAGDASEFAITTAMQQVIKANAASELDYNFFLSTAGTVTTVQTLVQASGTASIRNYVKSIKIASDALGAAGNLWILDGALTISSIAITTGLVTTSVAHDLKIGDAFVFTALAAGTGVSTNTIYYVTSVGSTTTFNFAATPGGANVVPSVAYTGTTGYRVFDQIRLQTTALPMTIFNFEQPLRSNPNMAINILIPSSLTSGSIYLTVNGYRGF